MSSVPPADKYRWSLPATECAARMFAQIDSYRDTIKGTEVYTRWVRAVRAYHGFADSESGDASFLGRRGSKGQRAVTRNSRTAVNARHAISMISQAVPSLDALPADSSPDTLSQVRFAKRLFDYYMERRQLGREYYSAAVASFKFGICWVCFDWDPFAGDPIEPEAIGPPPEDGQEDTRPFRKTTGDLVYRARTPLEVVLDIFQTGPHDWKIVGDPINRWELIGRYPKYEEEIKGLPSLADDDKWMGDDFTISSRPNKSADSDLVRVWTLYHRKCRALPQGRLLCAAAEDLWLFDGPLPYEDVPDVEIVAGDKFEGTPWADSPMFHATGAQAALDRALNAWITNVLATGHQMIGIPDPNFEVAEISDGVSAIVYKAGADKQEPKGIDLTVPQVERERLADSLKSDIDGTFAVNSVIRGEPDANIRSGAFAGLLVQQAVQYHSPAQFSFQRAVEQGGNHLLAILKRFADRPIMSELAGPGGQFELEAFTKDKLSNVRRLYAKPGNPASRTAAYRKSVADELLEHGLIKTAAEYMAMVETNEPAIGTEDDENKLLAILQQRERLLEGKDVPALETDDHVLYIRKFAALLDGPDGRNDPALIARVGKAIQAHLAMLATQPPPLAAALGQPVMAGPPPGPHPPPKGPPPHMDTPPPGPVGP